MTSGDLLEVFRDEVADSVQPYLWSDDFFYRAVDDAQKQFARRTDGIADSTTPAVCDIVIAPDPITGEYVDTYTLHAAVKKIRTARRSDNGRPVEILNEEDMPNRDMFFDGRSGPVRALITGMDEGQVRIWPVPNETVTIKLSVFRLPLIDIVDDQEFEIPGLHLQHLLLWVKRCAYLKQDAETLDKSKANDFEARFISYCNQVAEEQHRLRHKPRAVAYGGI